jgi:hypothetical protein
MSAWWRLAAPSRQADDVGCRRCSPGTVAAIDRHAPGGRVARKRACHKAGVVGRVDPAADRHAGRARRRTTAGVVIGDREGGTGHDRGGGNRPGAARRALGARRALSSRRALGSCRALSARRSRGTRATGRSRAAGWAGAAGWPGGTGRTCHPRRTAGGSRRANRSLWPDRPGGSWRTLPALLALLAFGLRLRAQTPGAKQRRAGGRERAERHPAP